MNDSFFDEDIYNWYQEQIYTEDIVKRIQKDSSIIDTLSEKDLDLAIGWYRVLCERNEKKIERLKKELQSRN